MTDYDILLLRVEHQDEEIAKLRAENAKLRAALQGLYDAPLGIATRERAREALTNEQKS